MDAPDFDIGIAPGELAGDIDESVGMDVEPTALGVVGSAGLLAAGVVAVPQAAAVKIRVVAAASAPKWKRVFMVDFSFECCNGKWPGHTAPVTATVPVRCML